MVCSADELVVWRDFPKGLRVLLLDEDCSSAEETRLKLEAMDYIVFSFQNERDALEAVLKKADSFHVAIVEMTTKNSSGSFRFLELAKDLPTVVISDVRSLSTMMKCIALGAAEFLEKPLSEDKLRNIWQHVVHKAFNAGADILSESLKPVKETVSSILQLQQETSEPRIEVLSEVLHEVNDVHNGNQNFDAGERFSAPSTPQLEQGERLLDGGDYHDQPNCSHETETKSKVNCIDLVKHREDNSSESKSVENTCISLANLDNKKDDSMSIVKEVVCDEVDSANGSKMDVESLMEESNNKDTVSSMNSRSHGKRGNRKRMKVDWTADLHRQFVQAVEQLGIDQAIPSKILELMNVEGLTRHNVASHLQSAPTQLTYSASSNHVHVRTAFILNFKASPTSTISILWSLILQPPTPTASSSSTTLPANTLGRSRRSSSPAVPTTLHLVISVATLCSRHLRPRSRRWREDTGSVCTTEFTQMGFSFLIK